MCWRDKEKAFSPSVALIVFFLSGSIRFNEFEHRHSSDWKWCERTNCQSDSKAHECRWTLRRDYRKFKRFHQRTIRSNAHLDRNVLYSTNCIRSHLEIEIAEGHSRWVRIDRQICPSVRSVDAGRDWMMEEERHRRISSSLDLHDSTILHFESDLRHEDIFGHDLSIGIDCSTEETFDLRSLCRWWTLRSIGTFFESLPSCVKRIGHF